MKGTKWHYNAMASLLSFLAVFFLQCNLFLECFIFLFCSSFTFLVTLLPLPTWKTTNTWMNESCISECKALMVKSWNMCQGFSTKKFFDDIGTTTSCLMNCWKIYIYWDNIRRNYCIAWEKIIYNICN